MGADVHCYVEFQRKNSDRKDYWSSFGGGINPGKNYILFGYLANVRGDGPAVIEPRGLPENLGHIAQLDARIFICDENGEGFCTLEKAKEWEKYGCKIYEQNGEPGFVDHPDWHSHTWLTPDELQQVYDKTESDKEVWRLDDTYYALLAAMRELEKRGNNVRLVLWFDN